MRLGGGARNLNVVILPVDVVKRRWGRLLGPCSIYVSFAVYILRVIFLQGGKGDPGLPGLPGPAGYRGQKGDRVREQTSALLRLRLSHI